MKPQLLLVCTDISVTQHLIGELQTYFEVWREETPSIAEERLRCMPDLVVAEQATLERSSTDWSRFVSGCELSGVRCVVFGAGDDGFPHIPYWCEHYLPDISSPALVREYLKTLTQLNETLRQLELSQGQLLARKFEQEEGLRSAAHIQQSLMPDTFPDHPGISFASCFQPCQNVGGDIFNVLRLDEDTLGVYMLDVSGHGVSAAMVTVAVYQALSPHTGQIVKQPHDFPPYYYLNDPHEVLVQLDREYPFERFDAFFTISYMLIDLHTGVIRFANGAHPSPLIVRTDGSIDALDAEGTLIGLGGLVPFEEGHARLYPGDRMFLYTDGLFEHENLDGEQFGLARMRAHLIEQRSKSLEAQCGSLLDNLNEFANHAPYNDDVTLLALEFVPTV